VAATAEAAPRKEGLMEYRLLDEASDLGAPYYPYAERGQTQRDRRISGRRF
jgi:hypothetical protein